MKVIVYDYMIYGDFVGKVECISLDIIMDEDGNMFYWVIV